MGKDGKDGKDAKDDKDKSKNEYLLLIQQFSGKMDPDIAELSKLLLCLTTPQAQAKPSGKANENSQTEGITFAALLGPYPGAQEPTIYRRCQVPTRAPTPPSHMEVVPRAPRRRETPLASSDLESALLSNADRDAATNPSPHSRPAPAMDIPNEANEEWQKNAPSALLAGFRHRFHFHQRIVTTYYQDGAIKRTSEEVLEGGLFKLCSDLLVVLEEEMNIVRQPTNQFLCRAYKDNATAREKVKALLKTYPGFEESVRLPKVRFTEAVWKMNVGKDTILNMASQKKAIEASTMSKTLAVAAQLVATQVHKCTSDFFKIEMEEPHALVANTQAIPDYNHNQEVHKMRVELQMKLGRIACETRRFSEAAEKYVEQMEQSTLAWREHDPPVTFGTYVRTLVHWNLAIAAYQIQAAMTPLMMFVEAKRYFTPFHKSVELARSATSSLQVAQIQADNAKAKGYLESLPLPIVLAGVLRCTSYVATGATVFFTVFVLKASLKLLEKIGIWNVKWGFFSGVGGGGLEKEVIRDINARLAKLEEEHRAALEKLEVATQYWTKRLETAEALAGARVDQPHGFLKPHHREQPVDVGGPHHPAVFVEKPAPPVNPAYVVVDGQRVQIRPCTTEELIDQIVPPDAQQKPNGHQKPIAHTAAAPAANLHTPTPLFVPQPPPAGFRKIGRGHAL